MIKNCYVYLIQETYTQQVRGDCAVKIGLAVDPLRRVAELQTGNARRLRLFMKIGPLSEKRAAAIEKKLHRRFKEWRLVGEWFQPCVISKLQNNMQDIDYETDVEIFSPPTNEDAEIERLAEQSLDRQLLIEASRH